MTKRTSAETEVSRVPAKSRKKMFVLGLAINAVLTCGAAALADDFGPDFAYAPPTPDVVASYQDELAQYGQWVNSDIYGRCWIPSNTPDGWRPYSVGHWIATDDGWTWVSEGDEADWGDTCFHYGRWFQDPTYGWAWVPGTVWAPAWVAWRQGDDITAWAPLPPECGDGVLVTSAVADEYLEPSEYVAVDYHFMGEPAVNRHMEVQNATLINRTTNITNINYVNNRVVNRGVPIEHVEQRSGHKVQKVQLTRATSAAEARALVKQGKPVLYSPPAVEKYVQAHPVKARTASHRPEVVAKAHKETIKSDPAAHGKPGARPAAGHIPANPKPAERDVKPQPGAHEETKPKPREHAEEKPQPRAHEEAKPQPREHEQPKGTKEKPEQPVKKTDKEEH